MYRSGNVYQELDALAIDIYVDYGINSFPLDKKELCRKMGILLIPYSSYEGKDLQLFKKKSKYGFCTFGSNGCTPTIFYNDSVADLGSPATIKQTIRHEIKHFACGDTDDDDEFDDLAEHFGRYLACPTAYLVAKRITDVNAIISTFDVSATMARNIISGLTNRINQYGYRIFDYEKPLLELFNISIKESD